MEDRCVVSIIMVEREGTSSENRIEKTIYFDSECLFLDDILSVMEQSLRGFGFIMDEKHLEIMKD